MFLGRQHNVPYFLQLYFKSRFVKKNVQKSGVSLEVIVFLTSYEPKSVQIVINHSIINQKLT